MGSARRLKVASLSSPILDHDEERRQPSVEFHMPLTFWGVLHKVKVAQQACKDLQASP